MREIIVDINHIGDVKIDAQGFTGNSCSKATEQLEVVLGGGMAKKKDTKPEYYAPVGSNHENKLTF